MYVPKNSNNQRQISGQKTTTSFHCLVIPSGDMWGSAYFLSRLQNYCPTSTPARYKARQFLKTCAVPLIKYKRIDSCAKPGSKKWCPACLEGNKKEIWTISLLTARSSAAGTKRAEWHWWMSLRFRCRNIQVENYLVRAEELACWGFLCAAPPLGQITKACWNLRASPGPISRTERDRHRLSCHYDLWGSTS